MYIIIYTIFVEQVSFEIRLRSRLGKYTSCLIYNLFNQIKFNKHILRLNLVFHKALNNILYSNILYLFLPLTKGFYKCVCVYTLYYKTWYICLILITFSILLLIVIFIS